MVPYAAVACAPSTDIAYLCLFLAGSLTLKLLNDALGAGNLRADTYRCVFRFRGSYPV